MANNSPIGIFDSGIGGLTVFAAIKRNLPLESIIYLGDTARVPYGNKSDETVVKYSMQNTAFLEEKGVKAIVVACNTASALALPTLCKTAKVPVIGVVEPGARLAHRISKKGRIAIIGTEGTVSSNAYGRVIHSLNEKTYVTSMACPMFVPLVEEGWLSCDIAMGVAAKYLNKFKEEGVDTLVLGCTHYPLLKGVIGSVMGEDVSLVDSGEATADVLSLLLQENNLYSDKDNPLEDHIYVTDVPRKFKEVAAKFLGRDLPKMTVVNF